MDTDIFVVRDDQPLFFSLVPNLLREGFSLVRCSENMVSIIRHDEYIDICFIDRGLISWRFHNFRFPHVFFDSLQEVVFLNRSFPVPCEPEKFLKSVYGSDWLIPRIGAHGAGKPNFVKRTRWMVTRVFERLDRKFYPPVIKLLSWLKNLRGNRST